MRQLQLALWVSYSTFPRISHPVIFHAVKLNVQCPPQVLFGTADGQVIVMDCHGRMLAHVLLHESDGIVSMSWNCPDFLVEDSTESDTDSDDNILPLGNNAVPSAALMTTHCRLFKLTNILFSVYTSAQSQAVADSHIFIRRYQFDEQL